MDNPIVGVRFIGPNESFTDKYFKTGAEWRIGTVHNFSLSLADKFFSYPCFERAEISRDGSTFVASTGRKLPEVAANINLHVMDAEKLVHLARYEFNRVINPEGKSIEQVRAEVRTLSVMHSLDLAEDEANSNTVRQVSADELDLILAPAAELGAKTHAALPSAIEDEKPSADKPAAEAPARAAVSIDEMGKNELAAFALDRFGVRLDKRTGVAAMRARVAGLAEEVES